MNALFLGSGTSHGVPMIGCECAVCQSDDPRDSRTRASMLIRDNGATLLIDASTDLRQQMLRHHLAHVDAVILTHSHADHVLGLDDLRAFSARQRRPMPVYADEKTLKVVRKNLDYVFEDENHLLGWDIPRFTLFEIAPLNEIAGISVTAVPIFHGQRKILGYRIKNFCYLTDCSRVPEESFELLNDLDTLVVGAVRHEPHPSHFSLSEALDLIRQVKPRRAFITHISHQLLHAAVEPELPPNVRLAYDGLELDLNQSQKGIHK